MTIPKPNTRQYRWHVTARVLIAVLMGYLLTNTSGILLTLAWPGSQVNAATTNTMLSFVMYTGIIMWTFTEKSLRKVVIALSVSILCSSGAAVLLYWLKGAA